jgi:hypothetical protein
MKGNEKQGRKEFAVWVKNNKEKIDVRGGAYLNQNKCHSNAMHFAMKHDEAEIAMVVYIDSDDWSILHFVNKNEEEEYVDNTLGTFTEAGDYTYYIIKHIQRSEFNDVYDIFNNYLKEAKTHLHWWTRFKLGEGRVC